MKAQSSELPRFPETACRQVEDVKQELVIRGLSDVACAPVAWDDERRLAANRGDLRIIPLFPNGFGISWKASTIIRSVAERYKKAECCCLGLLFINNKHLHLQQELYTLPHKTTPTQSPFYFHTQTTQWISSRTLWEVTRTALPSPAAVTRAQTTLTRV